MGRWGVGRGRGQSRRGQETGREFGRFPGTKLGRVNCISIPHLQVSQAAAELLAFCETHAKDDPLVTPVPAAENPFRDKRLFCTLL